MLDYGIIAAHDAVSNNGIAIEHAEDRWRLRAVKSRDQRPLKNAMRENGVKQAGRKIGDNLGTIAALNVRLKIEPSSSTLTIDETPSCCIIMEQFPRKM